MSRLEQSESTNGLCGWCLAQPESSVSISLQSRAFDSPQGSSVDEARHSSRRRPTASLGDESARRVDDSRCNGRLSDRQSQRQLGAGPLMLVERARIKASFAIEGENAERGPNDANRLAVQKLNDDVGHAHASPSEAGNSVACRISEHLLELRVRQAI